MKITESQIRKIINEEIEQMIEEGIFDRIRARASSLQPGKAISSRARAALGKAGTYQTAAFTDRNRKAASIVRSHHGKISKLVKAYQAKQLDMIEEVFDDLNRLGVLGMMPKITDWLKKWESSVKTINPRTVDFLLDAAETLEAGEGERLSRTDDKRGTQRTYDPNQDPAGQPEKDFKGEFTRQTRDPKTGKYFGE